MYPLYLPRLRPERLIAAGRVVLAASSLFAVWLDPHEPTRHPDLAYGLLAAYLGYAGVVAALTYASDALAGRWPVTTLVLDLAFFSLLSSFTTGPTSPFIAYFVFAMVCATMRWQWRGAMWAASSSLTAYLLVGLHFAWFVAEPIFDLQVFIIRGVYLGVVAVLLGYLGAHEGQVLRELSTLAAWPQGVANSEDTLVREALGYSAGALGAPRACLVWTDPEEPFQRVAVWTRGGIRWQRLESSAAAVHTDLAQTSFLCGDLDAPVPVVRRGPAGHPTRWHGRPIGDELARLMPAGAVLAVPLEGETFGGWLFFLDRTGMTSDHLLLGQVLARLVTARMDHFALTRQLRDAAATEQRIRLARDLHDGVLQAFTGVALRLAAVRRLLDDDPGAARTALEEAQGLIASEHRDLRFFIQELNPSSAAPAGTPEAVTARITELARRMEREWDLRVDLEAGGLPASIPEPLTREIYHLVREALVNAVRHGGANRVRVTLAGDEDDQVAISVVDNGRGFPFEGRFAADALAVKDLGPRNLRERVNACDGSLVVESGPAGARLDIVLPIEGA